MGNCRSRKAAVCSARPPARPGSILRLIFKRAVRRIVHILHIRVKWALTGQLLQEPRLQSLVQGLSRVNGRLHRPKGGRIKS